MRLPVGATDPIQHSFPIRLWVRSKVKKYRFLFKINNNIGIVMSQRLIKQGLD